MLCLTENQTTPRPPERLLGCAGHKICVRNRTRMNPGRYQSRDMRHVHHEKSAAAVRDIAKTFKIERPGIGACSDDHYFRVMLARQFLDLIMIDSAGFFSDPIENRVVNASGKIDRMSVRE